MSIDVHTIEKGNIVRTRIVVDIVHLEAGRLAEHWDVVQDQAMKDESKSGLPMFGEAFPQ